MGYDMSLVYKEYDGDAPLEIDTRIEAYVTYNWNRYGLNTFFYIRHVNTEYTTPSAQIEALTNACNLLSVEVQDTQGASTQVFKVDYYGAVIDQSQSLDEETLKKERMKRYLHILKNLLHLLEENPGSQWISD